MTNYLTTDNFEEVKSSNHPVIIDCYADWCGPCKMMAPVFESLSKEYHSKMDFYKLNTEEEMEIATQFEVFSIPTLIIMHKGQEIDRLVGFMPKAALKEKIDEIISSIN